MTDLGTKLAIALLVSRMRNDYFTTQEVFYGIEPESFAENWIRKFILSGDSKFTNLLVKSFIHSLAKRGREDGELHSFN